MVPKPQSEDDPEGLLNTVEFIVEARRPLLIERHRALIEEMELSLADAFITGESDNPRLQAILQELEADSEKARTAKTLQAIADDPHYKDANLRDSLIEQLCLLREEGSIEIATLQKHVIGVYREIRGRIAERQGEPPILAELRAVPVPMLARLFNALAPEFGSPGLGESLVHTPAFADRALAAIKRIRRSEGADQNWGEAAGEPSLPREVEEPLQALPEVERNQARQLLIRDRIRSKFYREVFLVYLGRNELDPRDVAAHPTVLHWLRSISSTPHLYRFMQGQNNAQKSFRLNKLLQKLLQLHEIYARVALASQHPTYRDDFTKLSTRERLARMVKDHYPPLQLTNDLMLATMLCPFAKFVEWVQDQVEKRDFVLPPDSKR